VGVALTTALATTAICAPPALADPLPVPTIAPVSDAGPMPSPPAGIPLFESRSCQAFPASADDSFQREAWHLSRLDMDTAWTHATGKGVTVAIIDTGMDAHGTAYLNTARTAAYDLVGADSRSATDGFVCTHGTRVAALIGAATYVDRRLTFSGRWVCCEFG